MISKADLMKEFWQDSKRLSPASFPLVCLLLFSILWWITAIKPLYWDDWLTENLLVIVSVPILILSFRRFRFSNTSYALLAVFMGFHVIGAHYTYAEVPWGNWCRDAFHLSRNHYDRLVHVLFGLFLSLPFKELLQHLTRATDRASYLIIPHIILAWSTMFELLEAFVAATFNPELGSAYLGTQGDIWDAQKDMALGLAGSILAIGFMAFRRALNNIARRQQKFVSLLNRREDTP